MGMDVPSPGGVDVTAFGEGVDEFHCFPFNNSDLG